MDRFLLVLATLAIASTLLCRYLIPKFGRFSIPVAIVLPIGLSMLIMFGSFELVVKYVSCPSPLRDCGAEMWPVEFFVAGYCGFASLAGSLAGLCWIVWSRRTRR